MYNYQTERSKLFTESGSEILIKIRDNVKKLVKTSGAFTMWAAMKGCTGDSFIQMAAIEYLVEKGGIVELKRDGGCWGQYRVFADPQVSNR